MKTRATTRTSSRRSRGASARKTAARASTRERRRTAKTTASRRSTASGRTARSASTTTDHDEIRDWVESRGGHPAIVDQTRRSRQGGGLLRIDFPGFSGEKSLRPIPWDKWFEIFDRNRLAFLYQEKPESRFNKLVVRQRATSRARR